MVEPAEPGEVVAVGLAGWSAVVGVEVLGDVVEVVAAAAAAPGEDADVVAGLDLVGEAGGDLVGVDRDVFPGVDDRGDLEDCAGGVVGEPAALLACGEIQIAAGESTIVS